MSSVMKGVLAVVAVGIAVGVFMVFQPERMSEKDFAQAMAAQKKLDGVKEAEKPASSETPKEEAKPADAKSAEPTTGGPNVFKVKFECSNGSFTVECHRDWAPLGVARFEELVKSDFFTEARFFRVVPGFVVQFGLSGNPVTNLEWRDARIKDDPVVETNSAGTLTFATSGPNSRTSQLFINLADNPRLDGMGFSPFGKVIEGMDVVKAINPEYGEQPNQGMIQEEGNTYLKQAFPRLDYIKSATIIP